jgi:hypothetical protein
MKTEISVSPFPFCVLNAKKPWPACEKRIPEEWPRMTKPDAKDLQPFHLQNTYLPLSPVNTIIEPHENKVKQVRQWKMEHAHQHTNLNVNRLNRPRTSWEYQFRKPQGLQSLQSRSMWPHTHSDLTAIQHTVTISAHIDINTEGVYIIKMF